MISAFANIWRVPELRDRILFTLAMVIIVRLGVAVTLPGVDAGVIKLWLDDQMSGAGGNDPAAAVGALLNVFSGGALQQCGLFALGIMPYISASIMMQLMTAVVPKLSKLSREEGGRVKINQYTRFLTIAIALVQGFLLGQSLQNPQNIPYMSGIEKFGPLIPDPGWGFVLLTVLTIVAGTMLLMWIGDQITERGIGNGISLIITVNIIAALPGALVQAWKTYIGGGKAVENPFQPMILVGLVALLLVVIAAVVAITQAQRRIAVQYAKRVVGRKQLTGQTQYLPLKVNYAGVMPIIFATAILSLPTLLIRSIWANSAWSVKLFEALNPPSISFYLISALMIFFFSYFWVATMFQPSEIAENLKKSGGYVPGVRPGKPTADFLDFTMTRLTFAGAFFLTIIYIIPSLLVSATGQKLNYIVASFFGGTSLLILVGVLLDILRQTETHLLQRHYDGFLRKGKIRGKYDRRQGGGAAASSTLIVYLWAFAAVLVLLGIVAWFINRSPGVPTP
ncbi:MAG: preprotein translocase subunit SecY [Akkermansiaceae bacterium]|nr:preprotein translocase subunit SecY [Akkermansiaceae bacterium]NNM29419.1 preprotein translocase subunit SecY [Akkermansiaceae bacterium]